MATFSFFYFLGPLAHFSPVWTETVLLSSEPALEEWRRFNFFRVPLFFAFFLCSLSILQFEHF